MWVCNDAGSGVMCKNNVVLSSLFYSFGIIKTIQKVCQHTADIHFKALVLCYRAGDYVDYVHVK